MYDSILEYIVNADLFYRLWMVGEMQSPTPNQASNARVTQPRIDWNPDVATTLGDVRMIPGIISNEGNADHNLDSEFRFHTGNKGPSIHLNKMRFIWGMDYEDWTDKESYHAAYRPFGPCMVTLTGLQMWHHQDSIYRRRGDAVICKCATFEWNTKQDTNGAFRSNGPAKITITNFSASYKMMGKPTDASFEKMSVNWASGSGIRLGESRVLEVIKRNSIGVNYLMADNAFTDPGEEFIFWDEVGRGQEAA